jgi:uncharacterized protein CbrC (UPF0167 family)
MKENEIMEVSYRYFRFPHDFSTYIREPKKCDLCGETKAGFGGPFYGLKKIEFVCEKCLNEGRLTEVDGFTNDGNVGEISRQLKEIFPNLSDLERGEMVEARNDELIHRTPHLVTWQDFLWPAHCGDFCCFIKEAGKPDLLLIAPEEKVHSLFDGDGDEKSFNFIWECIRPDSPSDNSIAYSVGVYLFQCLQCQKYFIVYDAN